MTVRDTSLEAWQEIKNGTRSRAMRDMFNAIAILQPVTRAGIAASFADAGKPNRQVSSRVKDLLDAGYIVELDAIRDPLTKHMARPLRVATRAEYEQRKTRNMGDGALCPVCSGRGRIKEVGK